MADNVVKGRLAPSPTGRMHAGNIFAALMAWLVAKSQGGRIVLRVEDLDAQRSKQEYIDAVQRDFERLGLFWDEGPYFQHDRTEAYRAAEGKLEQAGLLYPCFCTRADLHALSAPHRGEKAVYPGTCRSLSAAERAQRIAQGRVPAMRLKVPNETIGLHDGVQGDYRQNLRKDCGDFLVRRSDGAFAYQLAVVVDDALMGVTEVVRGGDLLDSTPRQLYLYRLLGFSAPRFFHLPLLLAPDGRRLSKRDRDLDCGILRSRFSPEELLGRLGFLAGLLPVPAPVTLRDLLSEFCWDKIPRADILVPEELFQ